MSSKKIEKFLPEKMRQELKRLSISHFFQEDSYKIDGVEKGELSKIFNAVYLNYEELIDQIEKRVEKREGYPYDEKDFRIKIKKLSLFINEVLPKVPNEDKFELFKSDVGHVKECLDNQIKILEKELGKNCYWGSGEITLKN